MGCRAITPDLVGLARRLEDKPFHLIATHCQRATKESVVAYLEAQGLTADAPNFTLTSFGGHPGVKGNGYVPYYMVFDHRGRLVRDHMGGAYHGGDGLAMIQWVDDMLKAAPVIYLGEEPFNQVPELAATVESGRDLGGTVKKIEAELTEPPSEAARSELTRLLGAVRAHRDGKVESAMRLLASTPSKVVSRLKKVAGEFRGSGLGAEVGDRIAALEASQEFKDGLKLEKGFERLNGSLDRAPACRTCRRRGAKRCDLACATCRESNRRAIDRLIERLTEFLDDYEDLPILERVRDRLRELRGSEQPR